MRWAGAVAAIAVAAMSAGAPIPAGAAGICRFDPGTTSDPSISGCYRDIGDALASTVCADKRLFVVEGDKLRIKNLEERNKLREELKKSWARIDCPEPARQLAEVLKELERQRQQSSDREDVQKLIAALFVVRPTDTGDFDIVPRPSAVPSIDAGNTTKGGSNGEPRPNATWAAAGAESEEKKSHSNTNTGNGETAPATNTKAGTGTGEVENGATEKFDRWRNWPLMAALVLLSAVLTAAMLFLLLRSIRGAAGMLDKRSGTMERSITAMENGNRKISEGVGRFDVIVEINDRLKRIETALVGVERALTLLSHRMAQVSNESQPRQTEIGAAIRTPVPPVSSGPARTPPVGAPERPALDIDQVVDAFNLCLSSGQGRDGERLFRKQWQFEDCFMDETGKLETKQADGAVAMWAARSGRSEFVLLPTLRQVDNDLAKLMGNGIEAARRKLGVMFDVQQTEQGGQFAVLERPAMLTESDGNSIVHRKGLLRLPFGF